VSRFYSYINSAERILQQYEGKEPFTLYSRRYFAAEKKFGSRDRKQVLQLCYSFFRLGKGFSNLSIRERILTGYFLCTHQADPLLETLAPDWSAMASSELSDRLSFLHAGEEFLQIFPWKEELSESMDHRLFCQSFLVQPDLFVRIRPHHPEVMKKLLEAGGKECGDHCVSLPNSFPLQEMIKPDEEAVIQDKNSQAIARYLSLANTGKKMDIWDCCAASGGKSLLAVDNLEIRNLTVSDIRNSILVNLRQRFGRAGIKKFESLVVDLSKERYPDASGKFDLIICDAPCSGSGTWSRTPEQLYYFDQNELARYASLQKKIAGNAIPSLRKGGYFLYITCSVFRQENEDVVNHIRNHHGLTLVQSGLEKGYQEKADTLFAALFTA